MAPRPGGRGQERPARERPAREGADGIDVGFIEWFHHNDRAHVERCLRQLRDLDVGHLRTGLSWADSHRPDSKQWFDWMVERLATEVEIVPCLSYTPPSRGIYPRTSSPPRDPMEYAWYTGDIVERYGDRFEWIELWNEPNNRAEWDWTLDPEYKIFSHMVIEAAKRAHEGGKKVVLGGLSPIDPTFLAHLGTLGVLDHIDALGLHAFPGTWERNWNGWPLEFQRIHDVLEQFGVGPEIWGTEIGFSTREHRETEQVGVFLEALEQPFDRLYWYCLEDLPDHEAANSGFHQDDREYHNGIIKTNGRPKLLERLWREVGLERIRETAWVTQVPELEPDDRPVVITGGAGFVGTNLAHRLLSAGRPVLILDNLERPGSYRNANWLRQVHGKDARIRVASVLQPREVRRAVGNASAVFHLAAQVAVTTSLEHPDEDFEVNARGTFNVMDAVRRCAEPPPLVFSSTNKVYGNLSQTALRSAKTRYVPDDPVVEARGIDESQPLQLYTPYGCSKGAADQYVLDHARMYDLPALAFRMSCIYGPHQHGTEDQGWVAHFLLRAAAREPITVYGDGRQVRDVLYVDDLVDAFVKAEEHADHLKGRAYNIGGGPGNTLSLLELLRHVARLEGHEPTVTYDAFRPGDQLYYVSDPSAFHHATGWEPKVDVAEGLQRLHHWIRHGDVPEAPRTPELLAEGSP